MKHYLDASVVVSLITPEAQTAEVQAWVQEQEAGTLGSSDWLLVEVASALSIKQRTGLLDEVGRARSERIFERLTTAVPLVPVTRAAYQVAQQMCRRWELGLRGGDALHLAVSAEQGSTLCTRDTTHAEAARRLGLDVLLLPESAS